MQSHNAARQVFVAHLSEARAPHIFLEPGRSMTSNAQTRTSGALTQSSLATRLASVRIIPGAVSQIAFGRYETPNYLQADYIANKYVTVTMGRFLTPFGIFNERLYPIWIRSLQQDPERRYPLMAMLVRELKTALYV